MSERTTLGKWQHHILDMLSEGAAITYAALLSNRNSKVFYRNLRESDRKKSISQSVIHLKKRRIIRIFHQNGEPYFILTKRGEDLLSNKKFKEIKLPQKDRWDSLWRLIIFDIPERHGKARRALSRKLKDMGALQFQKSILVYPYPCKSEVDFIKDFFQIGDYVRYIEATSIENDKLLKRRFNI